MVKKIIPDISTDLEFSTTPEYEKLVLVTPYVCIYICMHICVDSGWMCVSLAAE
jgi:hypothetical protein